MGQDGATHHGVYDISYLRCIPNLIIFAPMNETELRNIMHTAHFGLPHPIAIRYPRGRGVLKNWRTPFEKIEIGSSRELQKGSKIAILSLGHIGNTVTKVIQELDNDQIGHYDMRFVKPLDKKCLLTVFHRYRHIITVEDGCKAGGFGSAVLEFANETGHADKIIILGIDDVFLEHGTVEELHGLAKIDAASLKNRIKILLDA